MKLYAAIPILLICLQVNAQSAVVEQYFYTRTQGSEAMVTPMANFTTPGNWYGEARYNFDELNTFSLYAGKKFTGGNVLSWEATPLIGGLLGQMTGGSLGMNFGMDYKRIFFSTQSQYSFSLENTTDKFFYNWSEVGVEATKWLYAGIALQQTNVYRTQGKMEPGCMVGFSFNNWTIPFYAFNTSNEERYFVLGLNWQWQSKTKRNTDQILTAEQPH